MKRLIVLIVAAVVLAAAGFAGGLFYQKGQTPAAGDFAARGTGPGGTGGPMANLTTEEQAQLESMTEEERQAFLQEKMGAAGAGGPARGGNLEGEVVEVAADTITLKLDSGSQTVYTDADTVIAKQDGAGDLAAGATVLVFSQPSADGVNTASVVVVLK